MFLDFRIGRDDVGILVGDIIKLVSLDGVFKGSSVLGSLVVVVLRVVKSDGYKLVVSVGLIKIGLYKIY